MKIAYFSPLLPHQTGIAAYSEHLLPYLREEAEVSLYSAEYPSALCRERRVIDVRRRPEAVLGLGAYDAVVYQLGNNPFFHLDLYRALLRHRGVAVLHDAVLYFLSAGQGVGGLWKDLALEHGAQARPLLRELIASCPDGDLLRYPHPRRYPLLRRPVEAASQVIVHNRQAAEVVSRLVPNKPVHVVPLPVYPEIETPELPEKARVVREKLGLRRNQLLFSSLGFVGPTKRLPSVLRALAALPPSVDFHFVIVGEGAEGLLAEARALGLGSKVTATGFVSEAEFPAYLVASDVVINLRHPSMGEASATVAQALFLRRPCIVTDDGWFSELPDDVVVKVGMQQEIRELTDALVALAGDASRRRALGERARSWSEGTAHPRIVARRYLDILRAEAPAEPRTVAPAPTKRPARARLRRVGTRG